jgi:hypothetical protein
MKALEQRIDFRKVEADPVLSPSLQPEVAIHGLQRTFKMRSFAANDAQ